MDDKRVTADEIREALLEDVDSLAEKMAAAMNAARDGAIIPDSELPIRDAHAKFRQASYEKAIGLVQQKHEAFSPSAQRDAESRQTGDDASDG